jgi:hypothetical protein
MKHSEAYREWSSALESDELPTSGTPVESSELENLAVKISEVMKNPLTPTNLYNVMSDELSHVTGFAHSPEWILGNLKKTREGAKNE